ncbi:MAG: hypothetical protein ABSB09_00930 [Acidimicrobiales bacterium]
MTVTPGLILHRWTPATEDVIANGSTLGIECDLSKDGRVYSAKPPSPESISIEEAIDKGVKSIDDVMVLDLKLASGEQVGPLMVESIKYAALRSQMYVASYNHQALVDVKRLCKFDVTIVGIVVGLLVDPRGYAVRAGLDGLVMQPRFLSRDLAEEFSRERLSLIGSTVSTRSMLDEVESSGVALAMIDADFLVGNGHV